MPFALRPTATVEAADEREAVALALDAIRTEVVEAYGEAVELPLEPLLVLDLGDGRWEVMADTPLATPLLSAGCEISF